MKDIINIFCNTYPDSIRVKKEMTKRLESHGYEVSEEYNDKARLNLVIGGDGTFIQACHTSNFSSIPFIGINTGHLGFYQEIPPDKLDYAMEAILKKELKVQQLKLIECEIHTEKERHTFLALNEVVFKSKYANIIHFSMYVNEVLLQNFAGDGVLLATPSGSTAYNLSAGGAILYQTLEGFQITPMAPLRSSIFRTLDKSVVVPSGTTVRLLTKKRELASSVISIDGSLKDIEDIKYIEITLSDKVINKVIIDDNWFWKNIKDKLIK